MKFAKNYKILALFVISSFLMFGCGSSSSSTTTNPAVTTSAKQVSNYELTDPDKKVYQVAPETGETVKIDFVHKDDHSKDLMDQTYFRIMKDAPISDIKISEGEGSPNNDDRIRPYDVAHNEQFTATTKDDRYSKVRILRENYTHTKIVLNDKGTIAEVVFLQKKDSSTNGVSLFDIYLKNDSRSRLDSSGTTKGLKDVLEDCGSDTNNVDIQSVGGEVSLGVDAATAAKNEQAKLAKQAKYRAENPPEGVGPIPREMGTITKIKSIAGNNADLVDKVFAIGDSKTSVFEPFYRRPDSLALVHSPDISKEIVLNKELLNIGKGELFDSAESIKMVFEQMSVAGASQVSSPLIEIVVAGKKYYYGPSQYRTEYKYVDNGKGKENLGVSHFEPVTTLLNGDPWCGFTPESKPAIYLYKSLPGFVNVKLAPKGGWLSKSIPQYNSSTGWNVLATGWGDIFGGFKKYSHLFYEAMLQTPAMPDKYEVLESETLHDQLYDLGLRLSLNEKESKELADYWQLKLPKANYYKVGLLDPAKIDETEPINISPKPDSVYRLRLVFQPIDSFVSPNANFTAEFTRKGFTVVEWGGFVI